MGERVGRGRVREGGGNGRRPSGWWWWKKKGVPFIAGAVPVGAHANARQGGGMAWRIPPPGSKGRQIAGQARGGRPAAAPHRPTHRMRVKKTRRGRPPACATRRTRACQARPIGHGLACTCWTTAQNRPLGGGGIRRWRRKADSARVRWGAARPLAHPARRPSPSPPSPFLCASLSHARATPQATLSTHPAGAPVPGCRHPPRWRPLPPLCRAWRPACGRGRPAWRRRSGRARGRWPAGPGREGPWARTRACCCGRVTHTRARGRGGLGV